ncbi:MAG: tetratricopeptide repeat protein [Bacteroidales bacterium]|nr:tetratricopeptide repeat protein [Bacteroidales bacterium]
MKKILLYLLLSTALFLPALNGQPKKQRNVAATDKASVSARKIAVAYTDGLKAYYTGNTNEALKVFNGILLDNPKHDASHYMLARIDADKKDYRSAISHLQAASKIDKKNVWYKVDMAQYYQEIGEYATAIKLWEQICKEKKNEYYLMNLAGCYYEMHRYDKMIQVYDRVEEILGYQGELTQYKVQVYLAMDKVKEAAGEYDKLIKQYPNNAEYYIKAATIYATNDMLDKAMPYFSKAAELDPSNAELLANLFSYWFYQKDQPQTTHFMTLAFQSPKVSWADKRSMVSQYLATFNNAQATEEAQKVLEEELKNSRDNAEAFAFLAGIYLAEKKMKMSADTFEQAFKLDPSLLADFFKPYLSAVENLNEWTRLIPFADDLLELYPQNANVYILLGGAYIEAKDYDKAITLLNKAMTFAYEKEELYNICKALSDAYHQKGDLDKASEYDQKAHRYKFQ